MRGIDDIERLLDEARKRPDAEEIYSRIGKEIASYGFDARGVEVKQKYLNHPLLRHHIAKEQRLKDQRNVNLQSLTQHQHDLVISALPTVHALATQIAKSDGALRTTLEKVGFQVSINKAPDYNRDDSRHAKFPTYAYPFIKRAMQDEKLSSRSTVASSPEAIERALSSVGGRLTGYRTPVPISSDGDTRTANTFENIWRIRAPNKRTKKQPVRHIDPARATVTGMVHVNGLMLSNDDYAALMKEVRKLKDRQRIVYWEMALKPSQLPVTEIAKRAGIPNHRHVHRVLKQARKKLAKSLKVVP
jgi:DNA-directed RNA polymerase specialized sigma subunit